MALFIISGLRGSVMLVTVVHYLGFFFRFFPGDCLSSNCIIEIHGYTIFFSLRREIVFKMQYKGLTMKMGHIKPGCERRERGL
jgi:hypothetical protein